MPHNTALNTPLFAPTSAVPDQHGVNRFTADPDFAALLAVYLPANLVVHLTPILHRLGGLAGGRLDDLAHAADKNPPTLQHRSRTGVDEQRVLKHPAYQEMERLAFGEFALAALSHRADVLGWDGQLPATVKYALTYLFVQAEFGLCCPVSMTDSLTRTLKKFGAPDLIARYLPALTSLNLDELAQGAMFMTEQAAGSDIAGTQTLATPDPDVPGVWRLTGDKWFCSNPDAALAMVLARVVEPATAAGTAATSQPGLKGVSLFLLPREWPEGGDDGKDDTSSVNHYRIVRLKDKLGTRSMASGEIRLDGARAWLIGEPGRGFVQMADMVNNSRLSNGVRAAGLMRRATSEALHIAQHREAFGKKLIAMPLMQRQLMKLVLPTEQARSMVFLTAQALSRSDAQFVASPQANVTAGGQSDAYRLVRILTPLIKFRACRDARKVTGDAMEVRGGCGYIEEWADARLLRDAHLGSIWEGTSNIVALDVIRAIQRDDALPALQAHLGSLLTACTNSPVQQDAVADRPDRLPSGFHDALCGALQAALTRASALALHAAQPGEQALARRAASALYHVTSAIAMVWEASQIPDPETAQYRLCLAALLMHHRLTPQDPLGLADSPDPISRHAQEAEAFVTKVLAARPSFVQ